MTDKIDTSPEAVEQLAEVLDSRRRSNTGYDIKRGAETLLALSARVAELEALTDELDFLLNEGGEDSCASLIARAEAAEQRVAELEAELKASKSEAGAVEARSTLAGMEKE